MFLVFALMLSSCKEGGNLSSTESTESGLSALPPAIVSNSVLGPLDEPPLVIAASGTFQLANNQNTNGVILRYEGVSEGSGK